VDYTQVMQELFAALGAALLVANVMALVRRRTDGRRAAERTVARARPGSPVRAYGRGEADHDLPQAPLARSLVYAVLGFVVMVWGVASMFAK
jgi:hypothetical protein